MVSSTIGLDLEELLATLRRIKRDHREDAEYRAWRSAFPKSWPI